MTKEEKNLAKLQKEMRDRHPCDVCIGSLHGGSCFICSKIQDKINEATDRIALPKELTEKNLPHIPETINQIIRYLKARE